jgi:hypothetical protein
LQVPGIVEGGCGKQDFSSKSVYSITSSFDVANIDGHLVGLCIEIGGSSDTVSIERTFYLGKR